MKPMSPTTMNPLCKSVRPGSTSVLKRWRRRLALIVLIGLLGGFAAGRGLKSQAPGPLAPVARAQEASSNFAARAPWQPPDCTGENRIQLCQVLTPADPRPTPAIDCVNQCPSCDQGSCAHKQKPPKHWENLGVVPEFQEWAQGEYVGRARAPHVPTYRLRVDDVLDFVYRVTRDEIPGPYEINVGDELTIESATDRDLRRTLVVLPDGTITLPLLGQVRAANTTVPQLRERLEELYQKYYKVPAITVTPVKVDTQLEDLRYTVGGRSGFGGQARSGRVTPEGSIQLPAVGSVPAQGLTLDEFSAELNARYNEKIEGIEVIPVLTARAPRFVYVLGEVKLPGRYALEAPTTVMQAIAMAGSWNVGAHIDQVVVFRRADDWRLIATVLDLRAALLGHAPCPAGEIWVSDADLIIVPKSKLLRSNNMIELIFTRGLYGVIPFSGNYSITNLTAIGAL